MRNEIDGATVLAFFEFEDKEVRILDTKIDGLAICRYNDGPGYYLFYCDQNWRSVRDLYFESIEEARDGAAFEFQLKNMNWRSVD